MKEITVKGYTWLELDDNAKDTAFYYIENEVIAVQNYNIDLLTKDIKGSLKELEDDKIVLETCLADKRKKIKDEVLKSGIYSNTSLSPIYENVERLVKEELAVLKQLINVIGKEYQTNQEKIDCENRVLDVSNYETALALCENNELYFTEEGFPLFNGNLNTEVILVGIF